VDTDIISVREVTYLGNISLILEQSPPRVIQNYLIWRFMMNRAGSMPKRIQNIREQFDRIFKGNTVESTRGKICANYVNKNMAFAVSKLYIKKYFNDNARNQSKDIVKNIRNLMMTTLEQTTWMDVETKTKAIEKVIKFIYIRFIIHMGVSNLTDTPILYFYQSASRIYQITVIFLSVIVLM
jgi:membrane metallo-endopeptidase-like protein 1